MNETTTPRSPAGNANQDSWPFETAPVERTVRAAVNVREILLDVISDREGSSARWRHAVPILERFHGEVVWEGEVHVFDVESTQPARRIYAWLGEGHGRRRKAILVTHMPGVTSARAAVRASLGFHTVRMAHQRGSRRSW